MKQKNKWLINLLQGLINLLKGKRPGVHSKNASRSQNAYKKVYRGQGH
jgi:hypothetical protein